jgi:hypothetical protein
VISAAMTTAIAPMSAAPMSAALIGQHSDRTPGRVMA